MPSIQSQNFGFESVTPAEVLNDQLMHLSSDIVQTKFGEMAKMEFYHVERREKMYIKSGSAHILKYIKALMEVNENKTIFPAHFKPVGQKSYLFVDDSVESTDPNKHELSEDELARLYTLVTSPEDMTDIPF